MLTKLIICKYCQYEQDMADPVGLTSEMSVLLYADHWDLGWVCRLFWCISQHTTYSVQHIRWQLHKQYLLSH